MEYPPPRSIYELGVRLGVGPKGFAVAGADGLDDDIDDWLHSVVGPIQVLHAAKYLDAPKTKVDAPSFDPDADSAFLAQEIAAEAGIPIPNGAVILAAHLIDMAYCQIGTSRDAALAVLPLRKRCNRVRRLSPKVCRKHYDKALKEALKAAGIEL